MKTYRFGIVGLGVMGREMADLLAAHPRFSVAAGFDPARPQVSFPQLPSAEAVIADPAVDAVYTATPPRVHEEVVRLAARHRKPILCEKPLAHSIASARACRDIAAEAGIPAAVNFSFAARDVALRLGYVVASGQLDHLTGISLRARFAQWPRSWQSGAGAWLAGAEEGGFTREVVSHYIFLANRLFGPGKLQKALVTRPAHGTETALVAEISHGDLVFHLDAAIGGDRDDDIRFAVTGSRGEAAIVDWQHLEFTGEAGPHYPASAPLDHLALLLDGKPNHLATLDEGLAVVELIEAMLA
ncbi:putative dehydrogenase [Dongia mobilis]|uniref:Putative dehydrogenase n=1 Tax=Dongia mobilis TaxID=578943 RepID=A0A4V3DEC3_9PROT|nr:Gfo/Idh/MocA family oxidoreductase [Dongia mobilis]TDQ80641.1 putative dehydrogenase [Dongia mobilis]